MGEEDHTEGRRSTVMAQSSEVANNLRNIHSLLVSTVSVETDSFRQERIQKHRTIYGGLDSNPGHRPQDAVKDVQRNSASAVFAPK